MQQDHVWLKDGTLYGHLLQAMKILNMSKKLCQRDVSVSDALSSWHDPSRPECTRPDQCSGGIGMKDQGLGRHKSIGCTSNSKVLSVLCEDNESLMWLRICWCCAIDLFMQRPVEACTTRMTHSQRPGHILTRSLHNNCLSQLTWDVWALHHACMTHSPLLGICQHDVGIMRLSMMLTWAQPLITFSSLTPCSRLHVTGL